MTTPTGPPGASVDHFSTRTGGGAGAGARRLHQSLLRIGVDSRFWYWRAGGPQTPRARRIVFWGDGPFPVRALQRLVGRVRRGRIKAELREARRGAPEGVELFTPPVVGWPTPFSSRRFTGAVSHLHWVSGLLDLPSFFASLPPEHPVVWTVRDMNPFTGGCHFNGDCERFVDGCGSCPQLGRSGPNDLSRRYLTVRAGALAGANLHVVAPSRWMLNQARRSPAFADARSFQRIAIGVETDVFLPYGRTAARERLGLPADHAVVALGSERLDNVRKGLEPGLAALAQLDVQRPVLLLCFGDELPAAAVPSGLAVHSMGYVADPELLARVYSAADAFLLPALEDNLPKTGLEALACGTPVVAFDAGGIPDYVLPGRTGFLARTGHVPGLAEGLGALLNDDDLRIRMGEEARALILERFTARGQAEQYRVLYETVSRRTGGPSERFPS